MHRLELMLFSGKKLRHTKARNQFRMVAVLDVQGPDYTVSECKSRINKTLGVVERYPPPQHSIESTV